MTKSLALEIRQDHLKVEKAFSDLGRSVKVDDLLNRVFDLQNILIPHMLAEEKEVFSQLADADVKLSPEEARQHHDEIRKMLGALARTAVDEKKFPSRVKALEDFWHHHAAREEGGLLPDLERSLGSRSPEILQRYMAERDRNVRSASAPGRNWL